MRVPPKHLLNGVAVLWGTQHVIMKTSLTTYGFASLATFWRFILSTLLFTPSLFSLFKNSARKEMADECRDVERCGPPPSDERLARTIKAGGELSLYTFCGFAFHAVGLQTTTASKSAFLLYLNVKIVPVLLLIFFGRRISVLSWISAGLAFAGTTLLAYDGSPPNIGDAWCVAAACASALFIIRLEAFAKKDGGIFPGDLMGISFTCTAVLCFVWACGDLLVDSHGNREFLGTRSDPGHPQPLPWHTRLVGGWAHACGTFVSHPWAAVYLGIVSTGLCNYLQTLGQQAVPAETAAVIYSLDPVYGALCSFIFLDERLGLQGLAGVATVLIGVAVSAMGSQGSTTREHNMIAKEDINVEE